MTRCSGNKPEECPHNKETYAAICLHCNRDPTQNPGIHQQLPSMAMLLRNHLDADVAFSHQTMTFPWCSNCISTTTLQKGKRARPTYRCLRLSYRWILQQKSHQTTCGCNHDGHNLRQHCCRHQNINNAVARDTPQIRSGQRRCHVLADLPADSNHSDADKDAEWMWRLPNLQQ